MSIVSSFPIPSFGASVLKLNRITQIQYRVVSRGGKTIVEPFNILDRTLPPQHWTEVDEKYHELLKYMAAKNWALSILWTSQTDTEWKKVKEVRMQIIWYLKYMEAIWDSLCIGIGSEAICIFERWLEVEQKHGGQHSAEFWVEDTEDAMDEDIVVSEVMKNDPWKIRDVWNGNDLDNLDSERQTVLIGNMMSWFEQIYLPGGALGEKNLSVYPGLKLMYDLRFNETPRITHQ